MTVFASSGNSVLAHVYLCSPALVPHLVHQLIDQVDAPAVFGIQVLPHRGTGDSAGYTATMNAVPSEKGRHGGHSHARIVPMLLRLVPRLQAAFPEVKIKLRGDAGFALPLLYLGIALRVPFLDGLRLGCAAQAE